MHEDCSYANISCLFYKHSPADRFLISNSQLAANCTAASAKCRLFCVIKYCACVADSCMGPTFPLILTPSPSLELYPHPTPLPSFKPHPHCFWPHPYPMPTAYIPIPTPCQSLNSHLHCFCPQLIPFISIPTPSLLFFKTCNKLLKKHTQICTF